MPPLLRFLPATVVAQVFRTTALKRSTALWFIPLDLPQSIAILLLTGLSLIAGVHTGPTLANPVDRARSASITTATQPNIVVPEIIKRTTVRILDNLGTGSGVIIQKQGNTYTVLTCAHVVAGSQDERRTVLTVDGLTHPVQQLHAAQLGETDLALVQFASHQSYEIAELGNSKHLGTGAVVYAAGFPNWHSMGPKAIENTRNWGLRAFSLTVGRVGMMLAKPLHEGYQLGYTNDIQDGMSGGPVFDQQGQLVGINGRLKYPFQGISAFVFIDGTLPSKPLFQQMETLSWAIPIATFQQLTQQQ